MQAAAAGASGMVSTLVDLLVVRMAPVDKTDAQQFPAADFGTEMPTPSGLEPGFASLSECDLIEPTQGAGLKVPESSPPHVSSNLSRVVPNARLDAAELSALEAGPPPQMSSNGVALAVATASGVAPPRIGWLTPFTAVWSDWRANLDLEYLIYKGEHGVASSSVPPLPGTLAHIAAHKVLYTAVARMRAIELMRTGVPPDSDTGYRPYYRQARAPRPAPPQQQLLHSADTDEQRRSPATLATPSSASAARTAQSPLNTAEKTIVAHRARQAAVGFAAAAPAPASATPTAIYL